MTTEIATEAPPRRQRTGLSVSRTRRIVRRVFVSDRDRKWLNGDLAQALDPAGTIKPQTVGTLLFRADPAKVARAIGMRVIRDGKRVVYTSPATAEADYQDSDVHIHATRVEALFRARPGAYTIDEVAAHLFPDETPEQHRKHTALGGVVSRVAKRMGWRKVRDPFYRKRHLYGPPSR